MSRETLLKVRCQSMRKINQEQVVQGDLDDVLADFFGVVGIVGEGLYVGDEDEHPVVVALVLEEDTVPERTYVMAQMKFT